MADALASWHSKTSANKDNRFFVSYKTSDIDFVRPLCERLLGEGYSPWFNEYEIRCDQWAEFQNAVNEGIDRCAWGVLFVNGPYTRSPYCNVEVERLLRKLPVHRIVALSLGDDAQFLRLYPEFTGRTFPVVKRADAYQKLVEAGVIQRIPDPCEPTIEAAPATWLLKEIGATIDPSIWRPDPDSFMRESVWSEWLDITGSLRQDYHTFSATIKGHHVKLWIDYHLALDSSGLRVAKRIGQSSEGLLHFVENEEDDRERLREELRYFNTEAKRISELVSRTTDLTRAFSREDFQSNALVEEIGIHLFSTTEQNGAVSNSYKHRLFSFRLPTVGSIFRVYKLVLPHPQLKNPVTLRFIFQLEENVRGFFFSLPWMDYVVRSFKWLNLAVNPTLTLPRIEQKARQIRGATDV